MSGTDGVLPRGAGLQPGQDGDPVALADRGGGALSERAEGGDLDPLGEAVAARDAGGDVDGQPQLDADAAVAGVEGARLVAGR